MSAAAELIQHCRTQLRKVVVGQQEAIDHTVLTLLCGGHALLEGVPGMAKTLLAKTLAQRRPTPQPRLLTLPCPKLRPLRSPSQIAPPNHVYTAPIADNSFRL